MSNQPPSNNSSREPMPKPQPRGPWGSTKIEKPRDTRRALFRLLPYLKAFKAALILVFGLVIIYTLLGLMGPYLMGVAIDQFISTGDLAGSGANCCPDAGPLLLNNLFHAAAGWIMARVSQRALKQIRRDLFQHLQTLPLKFFDTRNTGELMSRLTNDIDAINQAVSQNVTALVASVLTLVGILIAMFVLNPWLALATVLVVPIMVWFTEFVAKYTRKGFRDLQKQLGGLNSIMEESISGQKVVKAFLRNETVIDAFREQNQAVYQAGVYANSYALLLMPLTNVLGNFFVIVLAGLGGWLALQGLVTLGTIATFINYGQNFIHPLRSWPICITPFRLPWLARNGYLKSSIPRQSSRPGRCAAAVDHSGARTV
jgi:ATP-binding cassette, subfamily B, multidrug efflux pump